MKRILITNDDGVRSGGITALAAALEPLGEVIIVAPILEVSAIGHGLTLRRPLRVENIDERTYSVDGTPTDCVHIAFHTVLNGMPDLVVSGINKGWNLGDDVTYSGTVAGALEGVLLGVPSIAISQQRMGRDWDFSQAAAAATHLAEAVLQRGLPPRTLLNVNVPRVRAKGFRVTVQTKQNRVPSVVAALDPRRQPYFWIEEGENDWEAHDRSDYQAVQDGWISVTPLHPDLTNHGALATIEELSLNGARLGRIR